MLTRAVSLPATVSLTPLSSFDDPSESILGGRVRRFVSHFQISVVLHGESDDEGHATFCWGSLSWDP